DCFHAGFDIAVASNDNDFRVGQLLLGLAEDGKPVHVLHAQIGKDNIILFVLNATRSRRTAGSNDALVAHPLQALGYRLGMAWLVVNDQHSNWLVAHGFDNTRRRSDVHSRGLLAHFTPTGTPGIVWQQPRIGVCLLSLKSPPSRSDDR